MAGEANNGRRTAADGKVPETLMTEDRPNMSNDGTRQGVPVPRGIGVPFDAELDRIRRRRRDAEAAAIAAENAAADAAGRAAAAIAAAARAAEEAEAAADVAARAADAADETLAAERQASAQAQASAARHAQPQHRMPPVRQNQAAELQTDTLAAIMPEPSTRHATGEPGSANQGSANQGQPDQGQDAPQPAPQPAAKPRPAPSVPKPATAAQAPAPGSAGVPDGPETIRMSIGDIDAANAAGGRAARRRAEEAAAASARDATRDPVTEVLSIGDIESASLAAAEPDVEIKPEPEAEEESPKRRIPVAAVAAGIIGLITIAAVAAIMMGRGSADPSRAAVTDATPTTQVAAPPVDPVVGRTPAERLPVDPKSKKAIAFLDALRGSQIPTSRSGLAETEAAAAICEKLDEGADEASLAKSVPAVLPNVSKKQSVYVVRSAKQFYC